MHDAINPRYTKIILWFLVFLFLGILFFNDYLVDFFYSYLLLYKYTTLFVVVFLAGLCVPIPINVLLMGVGALSIGKFFNLDISLVVATIANVLGDITALFFFRKFSHAILREKYIKKYHFFLRLEEYFKSHTNIAIFISRIVGVFGTPVNFLSGFMRTPIWQFTLFDFLGNFVFVFLFLKLGFWVGDRWLRVSDIVSTTMSAFSIIILLFLAFMLFAHRKNKINE